MNQMNNARCRVFAPRQERAVDLLPQMAPISQSRQSLHAVMKKEENFEQPRNKDTKERG